MLILGVLGYLVLGYLVLGYLTGETRQSARIWAPDE
jgi:hypothetical protein